MPDPISAALAALSLGLRAIDGISTLSSNLKDWLKENRDNDAGRVYYKVVELMEQRAVLAHGAGIPADATIDPVRSPILESLIKLYGKNEKTKEGNASGVVYVVKDKSGNGKSHGGRALLKNFHALVNGSIKGFMISGDDMDDNIPAELGRQIGATSVDGWIHVLLLAMSAPVKEHPSILIIDSFNSLGTDNVNLKFIKALYSLMNAKKNIFVVVLTHLDIVAQKLIDCNGGNRVLPLPGCSTGELASLTWNEAPWTSQQLIGAIRYDLASEDVEDDYKDDYFSFVSDGMTPLEAIKRMRTRLRRSEEEPDSPRKKRLKPS
jgi:hypothetical protein